MINHDYRKELSQKFWVDKGTEFAGEIIEFRITQGIQSYSTMSGTKVAFSERTLRPIKSFPYLYMEEYGNKYIYRLPQFVKTLISRKNRSIDLKPNDVRNSDVSPIFRANLYVSTENQSLQLEIEFPSRSLICHSERVTSYNLRK